MISAVGFRRSGLTRSNSTMMSTPPSTISAAPMFIAKVVERTADPEVLAALVDGKVGGITYSRFGGRYGRFTYYSVDVGGFATPSAAAVAIVGLYPPISDVLATLPDGGVDLVSAGSSR
jgi:hypothetical protein